MTTFVGVADTAAVLGAIGVERAIGQVAEQVHADFLRWEQFDKTPRVASHSPVGVIELMPTADRTTYGFKYVNGHPTNPERGFQTVTAFGALADVDTGYPLLLAEMTLLTAIRTAATSAVAARALARPDATGLALVGAGSQAEFQALGMRWALGIHELSVYDPDPAATAKLVANLEPLGFTVHVAASSREAVTGADVVTTCTADKSRATVLEADAVAPGHAPQRHRRGLPRQDRAAPRRWSRPPPCSWSTRRRPGWRARSRCCRRTPRSPSCGRCWPVGAPAGLGRAGHPLRLRRLRRRGLQRAVLAARRRPGHPVRPGPRPGRRPGRPQGPLRPAGAAGPLSACRGRSRGRSCDPAGRRRPSAAAAAAGRTGAP